MRHLTDDQLVDLVDGVVVESDVPHLAACAACRQQLTDLRNTLALAAQAGVPEPSPLFWDHFSSRVREAVAAQDVSRASGWRRLASWPGIMAPVSALAAAALIVAIVFVPKPPVLPGAPPAARVESAATPLSGTLGVELLSESASPDDQSLMLVAELTDALGWDAAADAGLTVDGSAEHALTHLSGDELRELEQLLKDALARKGA
jgi:hypothetical protein